MKHSHIIAITCALGISFATATYSFAVDDPAAALAKAPAAVQAAAKKELADKKLEEFDKEIVGSKVEFELGYSENGVDHAIILAEDGHVIQREADVEIEKLPKPVTDAVKKAQPDGKITEAAYATTPDGKAYFEIDVKVGDDMHAIDINGNGTLLSDEIARSASDEKPEARSEDKKADKKN